MPSLLTRTAQILVAVVALCAIPVVAPAGVVIQRPGVSNGSPDLQYGIIRFHPKQILIAISEHAVTSAKFKVTQKGNTKDHFRARIGCAVNLGKKPHVKINGEDGSIRFARTGLPVGTNVFCQVTVLGEGGVTGELPVYVTVGL